MQLLTLLSYFQASWDEDALICHVTLGWITMAFGADMQVHLLMNVIWWHFWLYIFSFKLWHVLLKCSFRAAGMAVDSCYFDTCYLDTNETILVDLTTCNM